MENTRFGLYLTVNCKFMQDTIAEGRKLEREFTGPFKARAGSEE